MSPDNFSSGETVTAALDINDSSPEFAAEIVGLSFAIMLFWVAVGLRNRRHSNIGPTGGLQLQNVAQPARKFTHKSAANPWFSSAPTDQIIMTHLFFTALRFTPAESEFRGHCDKIVD